MVALIALIALLGIGGVTLVMVRSELRSAGHSQFRSLALYAAESGANAAMDHLRGQCGFWSALVEPSNGNPQAPAAIVGNDKRPGQAGNPFAPEPPQWYRVTILNNRNDPGFAAGDDLDGELAVRAVGHGPDQTTATVEITIGAPPGCVGPIAVRTWRQIE